MIYFLDQLKESVNDDKVKKYISKVLSLERKNQKLFFSTADEYVYDVVINANADERFLVPDFVSAFALLDRYVKYYKVRKGELGEVAIKKRKVVSSSKGSRLYKDDILVECVLNEGRQIKGIYSPSKYVGPEDCGIKFDAITYPHIFNAGDLVYVDIKKHPQLLPSGYYRNYYKQTDEEKMFGINMFSNNPNDDEQDVCCFIYLSDERVVYRKIKMEDGYLNYNGHDHIDFGYIEKADLSELSSQIVSDYEYAKEELTKYECLQN